LRSKLGNQVGQRIRAVGGNIGFGQFDHWWNVGIDCAALALGRYHDHIIRHIVGRLFGLCDIECICRHFLGQCRGATGSSQRHHGNPCGQLRIKLHGDVYSSTKSAGPRDRPSQPADPKANPGT
jgi:hypothetical protein